jgi:antirestriction protein
MRRRRPPLVWQHVEEAEGDVEDAEEELRGASIEVEEGHTEEEEELRGFIRIIEQKKAALHCVKHL